MYSLAFKRSKRCFSHSSGIETYLNMYVCTYITGLAAYLFMRGDPIAIEFCLSSRQSWIMTSQPHIIQPNTASASPRNLNLRHYSDPLNQKLWCWSLTICFSTSPPGNSDAHQSSRTIALDFNVTAFPSQIILTLSWKGPQRSSTFLPQTWDQGSRVQSSVKMEKQYLLHKIPMVINEWVHIKYLEQSLAYMCPINISLLLLSLLPWYGSIVHEMVHEHN